MKNLVEDMFCEEEGYPILNHRDHGVTLKIEDDVLYALKYEINKVVQDAFVEAANDIDAMSPEVKPSFGRGDAGILKSGIVAWLKRKAGEYYGNHGT